MARFESELVPEMAPQAWVFTWTSNGRRRLLHGAAVRVHEDGFMEGCHDRSETGDPAAAENVFGSGMCIGDHSVLVITPSHTCESTYFYRFATGWSVSNSLSLLAAFHEFAPPWDSGYGGRFASIVLGVDAYQKQLFRTHDGEVLRFAFRNIELTLEGGLREIPKPLPPAFRDYAGYISHLRGVLVAIFAAAGRLGRAGGYRPLATCSSGYDSACSAALAADLGCKEAVTLRTAHDGRGDSGRRVGEILGLQIQEFDRPDSVEESFDDVAALMATGMGGAGYYFYASLGQLLTGRVFLTGFHGGIVWNVDFEPNAVLARGNAGGCYLQEFRLWRDFVHVPVPMIAAVRHPEIAAISRSRDMAAFRVGGDYDRPIPRRVLEEAGIPRSYFGQAKKMPGLLLHLDPLPLGPSARKAFDAAVRPSWALTADFGPARLAWELRLRAYRKLNRLAAKVSGAYRLRRWIVPDARIFEQSHPRVALEFIAGLSIVAGRYRTALGSRMPGSRTR